MPAGAAVAVLATVEAVEVELGDRTWTGIVYEIKEWAAAYETPTRNWMICMVVRLRLMG
jgi:hypothetical protein